MSGSTFHWSVPAVAGWASFGVALVFLVIAAWRAHWRGGWYLIAIAAALLVGGNFFLYSAHRIVPDSEHPGSIRAKNQR